MVPKFIDKQIIFYPLTSTIEKTHQEFAHRHRCPSNVYYGRIWACFLSFDQFSWNFTLFISKHFHIICESFSSICWEIKLSLKIHFQTYPIWNRQKVKMLPSGAWVYHWVHAQHAQIQKFSPEGVQIFDPIRGPKLSRGGPKFCQRGSDFFERGSKFDKMLKIQSLF